MIDDGRVGIGIAVGGIGSIAAAGALVAVRGHIAAVNVVLILVLFVLLGATMGGRQAGVVSALIAAASYDFFHTTPYNSLKIDNLAQLETTLLLLAVGLAIGEISVRAERIRDAVSGGRQELNRVHRIARLAARGETFDDLVSAVSAELTATLGLHRCYFELPPFHHDYARLEQTGAITGDHVRIYTKDGSELPRDGVELPLVVNDQAVGRFVLVPTPEHGVSLDHRIVAVTLADQLSAVLSRPAA
jgi:hypothetical protein